MSSLLAEIQLLLLAALAWGVAASALWTPMARAVLRGTARWGPASRHGAVVFAAIAPAITAAAGLAATLLPSAPALLGNGGDHCASHAPHHPHLCLVHWPLTSASGVLWLVLSAVLAWPLARFGEHVASVGRSVRAARAVLRLARPTGRRGVYAVPSRAPLCACVGFVAPRILVSAGFADAMPPALLEAALLHEEAHRTRRDALVRLLVRGAALLYPPGLRQALGDAVDAAAEHACDEVAATHVGCRLAVADSLLAAERALAGAAGITPRAVAMGITSSLGPRVLEARVQALLESPARERSVAPLHLALSAALAWLFAVSDAIHHGVETLVGFALP